MAVFKTYARLLFKGKDPTTAGVDCQLKENQNCTRHQLVIDIIGGAAAGTVKVRGVQTGSGMGPAAFDSRLDAVDMTTLGTQAFIFYGLFEALRFDFSGFGAGKKVSAAIISQETDLLMSENAP